MNKLQKHQWSLIIAAIILFIGSFCMILYDSLLLYIIFNISIIIFLIILMISLKKRLIPGIEDIKCRKALILIHVLTVVVIVFTVVATLIRIIM